MTYGEMAATLAARTAAACTGRRIVAAQGMGLAGDGLSAGLFIHPVAAIGSGTEAVPGLLDARSWTRTDGLIAAPVRARVLQNKESIRWLDGAAQASIWPRRLRW